MKNIHCKQFKVPVNFLKMFRHFLMYIKWLPVLVCIVRQFCLLIKKPDLSKLIKGFSMTNDEALTGTLQLKLKIEKNILKEEKKNQYSN